MSTSSGNHGQARATTGRSFQPLSQFQRHPPSCLSTRLHAQCRQSKSVSYHRGTASAYPSRLFVLRGFLSKFTHRLGRQIHIFALATYHQTSTTTLWRISCSPSSACTTKDEWKHTAMPRQRAITPYTASRSRLKRQYFAMPATGLLRNSSVRLSKTASTFSSI